MNITGLVSINKTGIELNLPEEALLEKYQTEISVSPGKKSFAEPAGFHYIFEKSHPGNLPEYEKVFRNLYCLPAGKWQSNFNGGPLILFNTF
jgi:hypothetical protein